MTEATPPAVELEALIALYYSDASQLGQFTRCDKQSVPPVYRKLLAHEAHMRVTVEKRHGCQVDGTSVDRPHLGHRGAAVFVPARDGFAVKEQFPPLRFFGFAQGIVGGCRGLDGRSGRILVAGSKAHKGKKQKNEEAHG